MHFGVPKMVLIQDGPYSNGSFFKKITILNKDDFGNPKMVLILKKDHFGVPKMVLIQNGSFFEKWTI